MTAPLRPRVRWLNRTVAGASFTSALGDLCYETTTVILPPLLAVLGVPAAFLGIIEGIADATASFTRMFAGFIADKLGHRKLLVTAGYALTPVGQILIALAGGWPLILAGRVVSWFGKGLRGPLRNAIVIQAVDADTRGRAFGFHRAMDSLGAVAGPALGVAILSWTDAWQWTSTADPLRFVIWLSLVPGVLAVIVFATMVRDPAESPNPALRFSSTMRGLPADFRRYLVAVGVFGLGDFSHSLLILAATTALTPTLGVVRAAQIAGLLYVWRNAVEVVASYPVGALADRVGARRVLVAGYVLGVLTALLTALTFVLQVHAIWPLVVVFLLAGLYMTVQDALESTVTAEFTGAATLATSLGALGTVNGVAKLFASSVVGLLWTAVSPAFAFGLAACFMAAGTAVLWRVRSVR
jgi:MFS family permease